MSNKVVISEVKKHQVEIFVNGTSRGTREINGGPSLLGFVSGLAKEHGLKSFTVEYNGESVTEPSAAASTVLSDGDKVNVQAKNTRGSEPQADGDPGDETPETPAQTEKETEQEAAKEEAA